MTLTQTDRRAGVAADLAAVNAKARRCTRLDAWGRESAAWKGLHEQLNGLLTAWQVLGR